MPDLHAYYSALGRRHEGHVPAMMDALYRAPYLDELPLPPDAQGEDGLPLLEWMAAQRYGEDPLAFLRQRRLLPLEAMTEFLAEVDWGDVPGGLRVQQEALEVVCHLPHRHFVLVGARGFTDRHLQLLLDAAPALETLELVRCPQVTDTALLLLQVPSPPLLPPLTPLRVDDTPSAGSC